MHLWRANGPNFDLKITRSLEKIKDERKICSKLDSSPRRFKLSVASEELRFNHRVQGDTIFIDGRPVIDMVDEATHFCAVSFLHNLSTKELWKTIQNKWSLVYPGLSDYLVVYQGTVKTSTEMKEIVAALGTCIDEAPIETPRAIGVFERYHAPLR